MQADAEKKAHCVMVLGTSSGAGKSWLATALCRYYARQGLKVAPFKAQNMSNNARVVGPHAPPLRGSLPPEGDALGLGAARRPNGAGADSDIGEIGSAQYFQALAARAEPDVRMNPLLLKPERDTHSQVVLLGRVDAALTAMPWRARSQHVWPAISAALDALRAENDVVVIEGAGSPAEINLMDNDIVNLRIAAHAQAACLLVTDIDRGGAFAHLYGTWALLPAVSQALIKGFVLNKFRGDASLLAPAPQMLQDKTGVPTVATLPMWRGHGLPEEDGVYDATPTQGGRARGEGAHANSRCVAILAYPRMSNLDEFQPLKTMPGVRLHWVRSRADMPMLSPQDWLILPGSKHTSSDLAWLRSQGLDAVALQHAEQGGAVLGVCGGLQMLGEALIDPHGIDGNAPGLGLLPLVTVFAPDKTVQRTTVAFGDTEPPCSGPWSALAGVSVTGYEIHHGQTAQHDGLAAIGDMAVPVLPQSLGWRNQRGNVLGVYLHGLFEDRAVQQALFGSEGLPPSLDEVFDAMADYVEQHFAAGVLDELRRE